MKVVVSVLCKGWTVSVGTGPGAQAAHSNYGKKKDGIGWLDGLSDQALASGPHIVMCPSCLSLSSDPMPPAVPVPQVLRGTAQGTAWLDLHEKCKPNQPPNCSGMFQSEGEHCCPGRACVGTAAPSWPGGLCSHSPIK